MSVVPPSPPEEPPWSVPVAEEQPARVTVAIDFEPRPQVRWTILLRFFLLIPIWFVLFFLAIAVFFVVVAAWFASLVTGRVPDGLQRFIVGWLRYSANVGAYTNLLTDRWPGAHLDPAPDDTVTVDVDHVELNRAAVFFRLILLVPSSVISQILNLGAAFFVMAMWFYALFTGELPQPVHQALCVVLRYSVRFSAYGCLATPTQPFEGMFGDEGAAQAAPAGAPSSPGSPLRTTSMVLDSTARGVLIAIVVVGCIALYFDQKVTAAVTPKPSNQQIQGAAPTWLDHGAAYRLGAGDEQLD